MSTTRGQPSVHASDYNNPPTERPKLIAVQVSLTALAVLIVALRLMSRYMVTKSIGRDDYAIAVAMILAIIQAPLVLSCLPHGAAMHYWDVRPSIDVLYTMKVILAAQILYVLIITAIKCSILLFYLRLSPSAPFCKWVKAIMAASILEGVVFILLASFQCGPVKKAWDFMLPGRCINGIAFYQAETAFSLATNLAILILPIPTIWHLQMALRRRLLVIGIFMLGLIPCTSLIARLAQTGHTEMAIALSRYDPTWNFVSVLDWEATEYCTGLICASLIHLKPLIKAIAPNVLGYTHVPSPSKVTTKYKTPVYFLDTRTSSRSRAIAGQWHVRSIISAVRSMNDLKSAHVFPDGIIVTTDLQVHESYDQIPWRPQKALLRKPNTL